MKRVLFAGLLLLAAAPAAPAQGWANKLFKDQTSHDFGTVARGAQLYHRFPITNIYAVPLDITNVRVSCGCLTATPVPKTLQPRESGYVEIYMDGRRFAGKKDVTVFITVGPTFISTAELKVSAVSRGDVVFNPGQVSFGAVTPGQTASQTIDVEYAGVLDWRITEALAKDQPFEATYRELYRNPGKVGYQVKVTLKADVPPGALKHELNLRTNDPASPLIAILVEADVQSSLTVSPAVLRLGMGQVGDSLMRKVVVRGQKPFRILSVEGQGDGITLASELPATPAATQVLTFKCQLAKAGELRKQLLIKTDQTGTPLTVTIEATVGDN
jgi:hypothetical protein